MSIIKLAAFAGCFASVMGHGHVTGITVGSTYYPGWLLNYYYETDFPANVGWSDTNTDNGYEDPTTYTTADIICSQGGASGALAAPVAAGGSVNVQWTVPWPTSHKGPVITYLANCNGNCTEADPTALEFFKIDESGLVDASASTWATDNLIANNNSWTVTIPSELIAGSYVMRHEIIALHGAESENGAQNYPKCVNIDVTGSGTLAPSGTLGEALYTPTDPGILVDIYNSLTAYTIPGPAMYNATASSGAASTAAASVATSAVAVTTAASSAATSAVVVASSAAGAVVSSAAVAQQTTFATSTIAAATSAASVPTASASSDDSGSDDDDSCDA